MFMYDWKEPASETSRILTKSQVKKYNLMKHLERHPFWFAKTSIYWEWSVTENHPGTCTKTLQIYVLRARLRDVCYFYFGGARATFFDKIGHAKSVGFRFYSAVWRSESRISPRYLEITSISLIYSLTFSRKKELLFWLSRGLNRLTCVTRQIRGDSKLRD